MMDVQQTTINAVRILSAEAIQKAKSGHPGLPMGSAPIGYALFQNFLKLNGILEQLEELGIQEGDTVRMYGLSFDYYK